MKYRLPTHQILSLALLLLSCSHLSHADPSCKGKWANPITDICWSCMFPMTLGSGTMVTNISLTEPSLETLFVARTGRKLD